MIPNLLSAALTLIPSVSFKYYKFKSNTVNERGLDVSEYELPITVRGLVAPVPAEKDILMSPLKKVYLPTLAVPLVYLIPDTSTAGFSLVGLVKSITAVFCSCAKVGITDIKSSENNRIFFISATRNI